MSLVYRFVSLEGVRVTEVTCFLCGIHWCVGIPVWDPFWKMSLDYLGYFVYPYPSRALDG